MAPHTLTYPFLTGTGPFTWQVVHRDGKEHAALRCPRCGERVLVVATLVDEVGRLPGIAHCPHAPCVWEGRVVLLGWSERARG